MKFQIGLEVNSDTRSEILKLLDFLTREYGFEDVTVQCVGTTHESDSYLPVIEHVHRDQGWCLVLDGEDQILGIPTMDQEVEVEFRKKALTELREAETNEDYHLEIRKLTLILLKSILGNHRYFETLEEIERVRNLVNWTFMNPNIIMPASAREMYIRGEVPQVDTVSELAEHLKNQPINSKRGLLN